jgi:hypothetical protein
VDVDTEKERTDRTYDTNTGLIHENEEPYAGKSGGAVGGTPAEKRSRGGKVHWGISPGGVQRGNSTIGARPEEQRES